MPRQIIYTIGHSNRAINQFINLLKAHSIKKIIDVRTIPKSRHNPQFSKDYLKRSLKKNHILYAHLKELGGLRHHKKDSINTAWRNLSFRGFADYMATAEFSKALNKLKKAAKQHKIAIMCAEAVPWRCHRSLIADALTKQKWQVFHIQSMKTASKHKVTSFLEVVKGKLIYKK